MLSPVTPNSLLKMHWSPEHGAPLSPWAEQHLDVSSTTSPPTGHHKHHHDPYAAARRPAAGYASAPGAGAGAGYPWASDDISALTASSLLKRYAEKYSGLVELPYDSRGPPPGAASVGGAGGYAEPGPYLKTEPEPWGGVECYPGLEALAGAKTGGVAVVASDTGYSGGSCSSVSPQDYPSVYNGTSYLPAGYCPQPSAVLPPGPLHALQSSYGPSTPVYNYPPGCYPPHPQTYSHPSASYLSAAPPLGPRPTVVGGSGYGYSSTSHTSLGGGGSPEGGVAPLKRKAFEMSEDGEDDGGGDEEVSRYRKYGNGHNKGNGHHAGNGHYDMGSPASAPGDPHEAYKSGAKPLMSPPYGGAGDYSPPAGGAGVGLSGESGGGSGEQQHGGFPPQQRMTVKMPTSHARSEDPTGGR